VEERERSPPIHIPGYATEPNSIIAKVRVRGVVLKKWGNA